MKNQLKELQQLNGIGEVLAWRLIESSYDSIAKVASAEEKGLARIAGLHPAKVRSIVVQARKKTSEAEKHQHSWQAPPSPGITDLESKHDIFADARSAENEARPSAAPPPALVLDMPVNVRSFSLALLALLAAVFVLNWARAIFIPLLLGMLISYALTPFVDRMHKWRILRAIGAAILLLGLLGRAGSLVYSLSDDASKLIETLPAAAHKFYLAQLKDRGTSAGAMENMQKTATKLEQVAIMAKKEIPPESL